MLFTLVYLAVLTAECYALTGMLFALVFLPRGIVRVDERLRESPQMVRVLLFPGVAAFWPLFAWRWICGRSAPIERNPHRIAAASRIGTESRIAAESRS
jgi:hypothetical protein